MFELSIDLKWEYSTSIPIRLQNILPYKYLLLMKWGGHGISSFLYYNWCKLHNEDIMWKVDMDVDHHEETVEYKAVISDARPPICRDL